MNDTDADSFTVTFDLQVIERIFSRISLVWKIACIQKKITSDKKIVSPLFRFSNKYWELTLKTGYYRRIDYIYLKCTNIDSTSTCIIYLTSSTISDENGEVIKKIPDSSSVLCFCNKQNSSRSIDFPGTINIEEISSMTISLTMCSEEHIKPVLHEKMKDEERDPLLIYDSKLSSDFEELYENRQLSDVTLKLGEQEFPAHKSVLSARSKVFAAMFEHDMRENLQSTVDLVEMEADTVEDMLRYVYCAKVRELSSVEAFNLYVAADRYDLKELKTICREAVVRDISINNVCDIAAIADIHSDELLIGELKSFISKNGKGIIKTEKWKETRTNNPVLSANMFEWLFSDQ